MKQDTGRERAAELARLRADFLRGASDELKTPVTVLSLALQRLETARSEEERRACLRTAQRSQHELERMVDGLLRAAGENMNQQKYEEEQR